MATDIVSARNERIRRLVKLRQRSSRDREGVFVVDGEREIRRAMAHGLTPSEIYVPPSFSMTIPGSEVFTCSPEALERASYRSQPEAVIAVFAQFDTSLGALSPPPNPLIVTVEGVEKPGNLGAILRTADAFGCDALVAIDSNVDVFNPNVIRASIGAVFSVPLAMSTLDDAMQWLGARGIQLVAASPDANGEVWATDLRGATALMVGAEHDGLTPAARAAADRLVRIPMTGSVDSLNASVSMALLIYEAAKQRAGL